MGLFTYSAPSSSSPLQQAQLNPASTHMAVTPRASGLWDHSVMTYSRLNADDDTDDPEGIEFDELTPLDKTIDRIGMGTYQWTLLSSCGFGESPWVHLSSPNPILQRLDGR